MSGPVVVAVALAGLAPGAAHLVLWLDRCGGEAVWRLLGAVAWGAGTGLGLALVLRPHATAVAADWTVAAGAAAALAAVVVMQIGLLRLAPGEGALDGVAHGLAAGAGLGLLGNGVPAGAAAPATVAAALAAGAVAGAGVGLAALEPRALRKIAVLLPGALLATAVLVAVRVVLDAPGALGEARTVAAATAAGVLLAVAVTIAAASADSRLLRRELAEEASLGVLPGWAAAVAPSYRRRIGAAWWPDADERRAVNRLLLRLAVRKRRIERLDESRGRVAGLEVGRMRDRLRRLFTPADEGED